MTEICFRQCVDNFNRRVLEDDETRCVEDCASKFVKYNNKLMSSFVKTQTLIVNKRLQETHTEELTNNQTKNEAVKVTSEDYLEETRELIVSEISA